MWVKTWTLKAWATRKILLARAAGQAVPARPVRAALLAESPAVRAEGEALVEAAVAGLAAPVEAAVAGLAAPADLSAAGRLDRLAARAETASATHPDRLFAHLATGRPKGPPFLHRAALDFLSTA
jgi:hypothetical protein